MAKELLPLHCKNRFVTVTKFVIGTDCGYDIFMLSQQKIVRGHIKHVELANHLKIYRWIVNLKNTSHGNYHEKHSM